MSTDFSRFDPSLAVSPRVYRTSLAMRIFLTLFGAALIVGGWVAVSNLRSGGERGIFFLELLCFLTMLLGAYVVTAVARSKVVLYADAIELHGTLSVKRLTRHEIEGLRRTKTRDGTILHLIPADSSRKPLRISPQYKPDDAFRGWLSGIPDLDALDLQREEEEVAADPLLGSTPEERIRRNKEAKKTALVLQCVAVGIGVLAFLFPFPDRLMISLAALLPCVAMAMLFVFKGVYRVHMKKSNVRPTLALLFIAPAVTLVMQVSIGFHLLDWKNPLPAAAVCAVAFACLMLLADQTLRSKPKALLLYLLAMAAYGYGAGALANAMFDDSEVQTYKTVVTGKRTSSGKSHTRYFTLAPWGPHGGSDEISVSRALYEQAQQGEPVCVSLRQGAFHMPWYVVEVCRRDLPAE